MLPVRIETVQVGIIRNGVHLTLCRGFNEPLRSRTADESRYSCNLASFVANAGGWPPCMDCETLAP